MIVTEGGKNIYPEDIEAAFDDLPCEELCVFAQNFIWPRRELGAEQLTIVVRLQNGQCQEALSGMVKEHNRKLVDFKRVGSIVLWQDEFPRTASEKLKRSLLAEQIRDANIHAEALSG